MKHLLTSTALVFAMAGGVHAETATTTASTGFGQVEMTQGDFLASKLIGMRIYNSETRLDADATIAAGGEADWDHIGDINDILITDGGEVSAVILGVGGFLGIDERDVAVPMSDIAIVHEADNPDDRFLVVSTTKEVLEQMPAFEYDEDIAATNVDNSAAQVNDGAATDQMLTRPTVAREGYSEVDMNAVQQMTAEDLEGATVYGENDEKVGEIDSLVLTADGKIQEAVVGIGGFLGLGEKSIAVSFDELQILKKNDSDDVRIYIDSTKDALEAQPEYKG